jgi:hypothetical protein
MRRVADMFGKNAKLKRRAFGVMAIVWSVGAAAASPWDWLISDHEIRRPPEFARPELHQWFVDPVFGTSIMRITDPSQVSGVSRIRHYYSKINPFNADETRAVLFSSDGAKYLYDTTTWRPIKHLRISSSDPEIQWHPTDPSILYTLDFVGDSWNVRGFYRYDIRNDKRTLVRDFREYQAVRGRLEGSTDKTGRYYAMFGYRKKVPAEAFVYDIVNDKVGNKIPVTERMAGDWVSVSPSGRYVVMMGDISRVFDINMKHIRDLPKGSFGHGDICQLADGTEALVYDGADHQLDRNRNINIANLDTGKISIGVRIGWGSTPHVSCRNLDLPGWALISTQGPDRKYPNHDFEIFWLRLDGSGEVRRVAHHHSSRKEGGYFAEQQAVTNRDGTKIMFASNWGDGPIASYLIDLKRLAKDRVTPASTR